MDDNIINNTEDLSEILQIRRGKLDKLRQEGRDPFIQTRFERSAYAGDIKSNFDAMENQTVSAAGRIMSKRDMARPFSAICLTLPVGSSSM
jgi:lysyl-tRNA synthetase class 2